MAFAIVSAPVSLCHAIKCTDCGKTTWAGCGKHAEAVMSNVKDEDKCACKDDAAQSE